MTQSNTAPSNTSAGLFTTATAPWFWILLVVTVVAAIAISLVTTYPDRTITIAAGPVGSYFDETAQKYAAELKHQGLKVTVLNTAGARENIERINDPKQDVDLAFTHGGVTNAKDSPALRSLSSIDYDPVWIFYRKNLGSLTTLNQLKGLRIAIGKKGSGMNGLSLRLLGVVGISTSNSRIIEMDLTQADEQLSAGAIDVAIVMDPPETQRVQDFFKRSEIVLMNLTQAEALRRNLPYLHVLNIPAGTLNLANQIPAQDTTVIATTITVVARETTHPAFVYLLMSELDKIHEPPSLIHSENEFPSDKDVDLPLSTQSERYFKDGKPFLQRYLPFWIASTLERLIAILIPLLAILIPVVKAIPWLMSWRNQNKITSCYQQLMDLEHRVMYPDQGSPSANGDVHKEFAALSKKIDRFMSDAKLPMSYSNQIYVLKEHIELVHRRLTAAG